MLDKLFSSFIFLLCFLSAGCVTHFSSESNIAKSQLSPQEKALASSYNFNVPCHISVNASDDMAGHNDSMWYDTPFGYKDIYHYPLRTLLNGCFNNLVCGPFEQSKGNLLNSFELRIEPQSSLLLVDGAKAQYKLVLYISLYEPGGNKIVSWSIDKTNSGLMESPNEVPDVVYKTIKEIAMDVLKRISTDNKVMSTVSRYSDK